MAWIPTTRAPKLPVIVPATTILGSNPPATHSNTPATHSNPPVVVLHGFTGCAEAMEPLTQRLAQSRHCIVVDLIGHGTTEAPADVGRYSLTSFARSLVQVLDNLVPVHLVGYSLGGRAALTFAHTHPDKCATLTLIGASPGITDVEQRIARRRDDYALARRISRLGVAGFVQEWVAQPLWDSLRRRIGPAAWQASIAQRARSHPVGLSHSLRGAGVGAMKPLVDELGDIAVQTLTLAGEEDVKFCAMGRTLAQQMPDCEFEAIAEAGHAAHLEQPDAVASLILAHTERWRAPQ